MANTTNLNMVKPAGTDHALISVINSNMDIIDGAVGALPSGSTLQEEIESANTAIANMVKSLAPVILNIVPTAHSGVSYQYEQITRSGNVISISLRVSLTNATSGYLNIYSGLPNAKATGGIYFNAIGSNGNIAIVAFNASGDMMINSANADTFFINTSYICA